MVIEAAGALGTWMKALSLPLLLQCVHPQLRSSSLPFSHAFWDLTSPGYMQVLEGEKSTIQTELEKVVNLTPSLPPSSFVACHPFLFRFCSLFLFSCEDWADEEGMFRC